jgi:allophanate hydrolase
MNDLPSASDRDLRALYDRPAAANAYPPVAPDEAIPVAVFGAHMRGQPLNAQMLALGGVFSGECRTAPLYRCHLIGGQIPRPGLVRSAHGGATITGEIWRLPPAGFGRLVNAVAPPLVIGTVELADGSRLKGYLCEEHGALGTTDITHFGSWRAFLASR